MSNNPAQALALIGVAGVYIAIQGFRAPRRQQQPGVTPSLAEPAAQALPSLIPQVTDEIRVAKGLSRTKVFFQQTFDKLFAGAKAESHSNFSAPRYADALRLYRTRLAEVDRNAVSSGQWLVVSGQKMQGERYEV